MWKAAAGQQIKLDIPASEDDEWETDPDFVNDVTEQEQRWGSTTVAGSGRTAGAIDMCQLRRETQEADALRKKKQLMEDPSNPSFGYGGKFGVEKDRMDQSAVGHEYVAKVEKHASQKDYTTGFGGKFGVQTDRVDKSAVSWEHKEKIEKHTSQKDYVVGFGGKFGVQSDRQDKSAVGWDHVEKLEKHESQKDYVKGFGGKFGVQLDRQDKSAVGWDHHEASQKHESQTDHKIGFGGKFGLQTDRVDKSAVSFNDEPTKVGTNYTKVKPDIAGAKPSDLRAKFEEMSVGTKIEIEKNSIPKKSVHAKAAVFANNQKSDATTNQNQKIEPKSLDPSKFAQFTTAQNNLEGTLTETSTRQKLDESRTAFLTQTQQDEKVEKSIPQQLNQNKVQLINQEDVVEPQQKSVKVEEIEEKSKQQQQQQILMQEEEQIYENLQSQQIEQTTPTDDTDTEYYSQDEIVDTGISAIALYDYQAAADDEISFDPDDLITHIEKIDEGWWRGLCKGKYGLFPANYVQVNE